jgi:hypothetical protein
MRKVSGLWLAAVLCPILSLTACSSDSSPAAGSGGGGGSGGGVGSGGAVASDATVTITSPADNSTLSVADLDDGTDYNLLFTTTHFTLADVGMCAGMPTPCGHAQVFMDGMDCNNQGDPTTTPPEKATPFSAEGISPLGLGFDYCIKGVTGTHSIMVELHNDDATDSVYKDKTSGKSVTDTINITIDDSAGSAAGAGGAP